MKGIDILLWAAGVAAAVFAIYELMRFATARDPATGFPDMWAGVSHLYLAVGAGAVAAVCIVWAFVRRPHGVEEIHITK